MTGVTPIGIITSLPAESRQFYREVLGVDRVQFVKELNNDGLEGMLIRLESPWLEVFSTETRLMDRTTNRVVRRDFSLQIHPVDVENLLVRLEKANVAVRRDARGTIRFEDFNGISWEVRPEH
jgi:catechol 2,3-dioxygenase-like lactoylglutathione lyase family enzyme